MDILEQHWDVVIVGSGAAALTSALSAVTSTTPAPKVLLVDKCPEEWAGGNGYFTAGAYRTAHNGLEDILPLVSNVTEDMKDKIDLPVYSETDFKNDLERVTGGRSDVTLGKHLTSESLDLVRWLYGFGVDWMLSFKRQAYKVDGRFVFWGGLHLTVKDGGKGLIKNLTDAVRDHGCTISHDTPVTELLTKSKGGVCGVAVEKAGKKYEIKASSVILCAGGFEADAELRKKYLGPGWELAHTRGTPYNTGDMLTAAISLGAKMVGDFSPGGCHSTCWDAASPKDRGDREKTNEFTKSGYPLGLMLNAEGKRFVDEGIDLRNYTYAKFGRAILEQPKGVAFQVWDSDGQKWLRDEEYRDEIVPKITANSIEELAQKCSVEGLDDPGSFVRTIEQYNDAVAAYGKEHPDTKLNPAILDGLSTQSTEVSLDLAKSNWALPIVRPPFLAVKVTTGITFTFGGLAINPQNAAVLRNDNTEIDGLFANGEIVGSVFFTNYPGGSGLTLGAVFGRRAGRAAAHRCRADASTTNVMRASL